MTYLEKLRDVIRRLHEADSRHVASAPVKETFAGKTYGTAWSRYSI
jgi:hypothetical protein